MLISLNDLENDWKCHYSNWLTNWQTDQPKNRLINFTNHMHYKKQQHRFKAISSFYCFKMLFLEYLIVAKALDGQRYPLPLCECMWVCDSERGSGPEGADDLCSVCFEAWGWDLSHDAGYWPSSPEFELRGWNLSLEAGIWASKLGIESQSWESSLHAGRLGGWDLSLEAEPQRCQLSLEAGNWASKLGFEPRG